MADRFNRRKLLILAQAISAAGAVGLAVWVALTGVEGLPGVWPVLAASGIIGLGYAVGISAMNALIPGLVDIHVHGALGSSFNSPRPQDWRRVMEAHAMRGTMFMAPTVATAPWTDLLAALLLGLGVPPGKWQQIAQPALIALLVLTILNRARRALAQPPSAS